MATGVIKTIRDERGFGFIAPDSDAGAGHDLFFHRSSVELNGFDNLREGQHVSFNEEPDPRDSQRQRAVNVSPIERDGNS